MKNRASTFFKKVICLLSSIAKAKSISIKNKTNAAKARLVMFSLMKGKKLLVGSISNKIHGLLGHHGDHEADQSKAIVLYNAIAAMEPAQSSSSYPHQQEYYNDHDEKYPDPTHSLFNKDGFESDDDDDDQGGSIIDLVKNSKEGGGNDFSLEEEIDHVADLFIKRFHKQMRLQKLESFKRFQEMLARGV
ncbi:uncharacterized protein LOC123193578 [Mangifera indica]|uniref:uncharacterized protein LOC123193578 n=1 Tax=Mangifera indica TaxID=29780 RepID=UPI001CFB3735|nr:uncharacterized protein LOC123193578 [Mangifera indica]